MYDNGNLPLKTEAYGMGLRIRWDCDYDSLDYLNLVPLFLKGIFCLSLNLYTCRHKLDA